MGMGIDLGHFAVRGPTGMGDAGFASHGGQVLALIDLLHAAHVFAHGDLAVVDDPQAARVVAPVFQTANGLVKDLHNVLSAGYRANPAHRAPTGWIVV